MPSTSAAALPGELVDAILEYLLGGDNDQGDSIGTSSDKRDTVACSLACRYWAQRCRPHLFSSLTLRTLDDLLQLVDFLAHPSSLEPTIQDCQPYVSVAHISEWSVPWSHRLRLQLSRYLSLDSIKLELCGSYFLEKCSQEDRFAPSSLCAGLPRSLPKSMFPNITVVSLSETRFRSMAHFLRLLDSVAGLRHLYCEKIIFATPPSILTQQRPIRHNIIHIQFSYHDLPHISIPVSISLCSSLVSGHNYLWHPNYWLQVQKLVSAVFPSYPHELEHVTRITWKPSEGFLYRFYKPELQARTRSLEFCIDRPLQQLPAVLSSVELYLYEKSMDEALLKNWGAFEDAVLALDVAAGARVVIFSKDLFLWLLDVLPQSMVLPRLLASGRLHVKFRCVVGNAAREVSLDDMLHPAAKCERTVDGLAVPLTAEQRLRFLLCETADEKQGFLFDVVTRSISEARFGVEGNEIGLDEAVRGK